MQENWSLVFPTRCDTNRPVQSQKQARSLKFWIEEEERWYYLCSENKAVTAKLICAFVFANRKTLVFS